MDNGFDSAIIFSHDHGISDFVNNYGHKNIDHVPTCGVVAIEFKTNHWKNIKNGKTLFTEFDPQIYFGGDNSMFWSPMSWTVIFGLAFATFLTLVIVPVMYLLGNKVKLHFAKQ